jgi:EAL domain-containing protein (putative c-di-GMP-specific phosphodiesterase class I)
MSIYPQDGDNTASLIKNADIAMYHAKDQGKNNYQYYSESMNSRALELLTMESDLMKAVENNELILHYQPQVDINDNTIVGLEALVRWQHPELGMVSPIQFIPLAEETGLIVPLSEWVTMEACRQNKEWLEKDGVSVPVSVNMSSLYFQRKEVLSVISNILKSTGLPPEYLDIELTESSIMRSEKNAIMVLGQLKKMGIRISLDDFGTGYSSLNYLRRFPIDTLKIDRDFVKNIASDEVDAAIISAIINLADTLNLRIVAEGIEEYEQLDILREYGCDVIQGYLFSKPLPAREIETLLMKNQVPPEKKLGT